MELEVYKKSDFYEDYIDSQKEYYERENADAYFAERLSEKDKEIAELKKKLMPCLNGDCILTCEVVEKYGKENAELKQKLDKAIAERDGNQVCIDALKEKLEDVQASAYADSVDAGMCERRLRRALWLARAKMAFAEAKYNNQTARRYEEHKEHTIAKRFDVEVHQWKNVKTKCIKKAEEYK